MSLRLVHWFLSVSKQMETYGISDKPGMRQGNDEIALVFSVGIAESLR